MKNQRLFLVMILISFYTQVFGMSFEDTLPEGLNSAHYTFNQFGFFDKQNPYYQIDCIQSALDEGAAKQEIAQQLIFIAEFGTVNDQGTADWVLSLSARGLAAKIFDDLEINLHHSIRLNSRLAGDIRADAQDQMNAIKILIKRQANPEIILPLLNYIVQHGKAFSGTGTLAIAYMTKYAEVYEKRYDMDVEKTAIIKEEAKTLRDSLISITTP